MEVMYTISGETDDNVALAGKFKVYYNKYKTRVKKWKLKSLVQNMLKKNLMQ